MNLFKTAAMVGLVAMALTGCGVDDAPAPKVARKPKAPVAHTPKAAPTKPAKAEKVIEVGTKEYLDAKHGFRDAIFGQNETEVGDLSLVSKDERLGLATYVRAGDVKELEGVPLESIRYTFFQGRLARVDLKWKAEYPGSVTPTPLSTEMAARCSTTYGRPRKQSRTKEVAQYLWAGETMEILVDEFFLPGIVQPMGKPMDKYAASSPSTTWLVPPTTTGQMVMRSIPLKKEIDSRAAQLANETHNGL
ncbi:MAG: hypothetical protein RLZZ350_1056 [Verrucomicrobiota bacterium]|jgi:hypothetical protein